ncbi:MAG: hypothetical protein EOL93_08390 [Epsilonproteobacteria bacterium]|nr:hypothetical protein [Campylobacterota bacterium]
MYLNITEDFLQLDYEKDMKQFNPKTYFKEEGSEKFDGNSSQEMLMMLNQIGEDLHLDDYSLKKLEIFLKTELPFFAVNRRLIREWVQKNFVY